MMAQLEMGEPHPAAFDARDWIVQNVPVSEMFKLQEAFSSLAIENQKLAEICSETLKRLMDGDPVGDRYVLGLAWTIRSIMEMGDGLSINVDIDRNLADLIEED
jgi:hypothetical protein